MIPMHLTTAISQIRKYLPIITQVVFWVKNTWHGSIYRYGFTPFGSGKHFPIQEANYNQNKWKLIGIDYDAMII